MRTTWWTIPRTAILLRKEAGCSSISLTEWAAVLNAITGFGISLLNEDTYTSIENITGSQNIDILMGNAGTNVIDGGGGADLLLGEGGNDVLHGGTGDDLISAGSNVGETSQLFGDDGNDTWRPAAPARMSWMAARATTGSTTRQHR